jgi:hypothetical protein
MYSNGASFVGSFMKISPTSPVGTGSCAASRMSSSQPTGFPVVPGCSSHSTPLHIAVPSTSLPPYTKMKRSGGTSSSHVRATQSGSVAPP